MKKGDKVIIKNIFSPDSYSRSQCVHDMKDKVFILNSRPERSLYGNGKGYIAYLKVTKRMQIGDTMYSPEHGMDELYVINALFTPYIQSINKNIKVL